jgi:cation transport ATPase
LAGDRDFAAQRDQVRWGPLWAGVVVTVAAYLLMQLAIFAAGLFRDGGDAGTLLTAVAALLAFFIGGLTVAGTALWHKVTDGVLHGVLLWAFATVGLLVLALIGGGTLLGPVSTVAPIWYRCRT